MKQTKKDTQLVMVLKISSKDLAYIMSSGNLNGAYQNIRQHLFKFAQEVNQKCISFFNKNTMNPSDIPKRFTQLNKKTIDYFDPNEQETAQVFITDAQYYEWACKSPDWQETGKTQEYYDLFKNALFFYNKICKDTATLQQDCARQYLESYFAQGSLDVFAVVPQHPSYLDGDFDSAWQRILDQKAEVKKKGEAFDKISKLLKSLPKNLDLYEGVELLKEKHPEEIAEAAKLLGVPFDKFTAADLWDLVPVGDTSLKGFKTYRPKLYIEGNINIDATIPLHKATFYLKKDEKMVKHSISELISMHDEYNSQY